MTLGRVRPATFAAAFILGLLVFVAPPASGSGAPPVLTADVYDGRIGQVVDVRAPGVLANDVDPEGDLLTVRLAYGPPQHGSLDLRGDGSFAYAPAAGHPGYDSFAYQAFDGTSWSVPTHVYLTLWGDPVANDDRYYHLGWAPLQVPAEQGLVANDAGQPPLRPKVESTPRHGTLELSRDGSFTYTLQHRFIGTDSFTYRVRDAAGVPSKIATVTITVARTNVSPVATPDEYQVLEDTTLVIPAPGVLKNDVDRDGNELRAEVVDYPTEGDLDLREDGSLTFVTARNQDNNAFFTYRVTDGFSWSEPVTVFIDVIAVNDPPTAEPDSYWLLQDTVLTEPPAGVLANDHDDIEFDEPIVWALVSGPSSGKLTLDPSGGFTYEPDAGFSGADRFVYRVGDVGGPGGTATVDLFVEASGG